MTHTLSFALRTRISRVECENDKEHSACHGNLLFGDLCRQQTPSEYCKSGAKGVPKRSSHCNAKRILAGSERDGSHLRAIAPLCKKCEGERFHENVERLASFFIRCASRFEIFADLSHF